MTTLGETESELARITAHFRGRSVLVTGAFGFVGGTLVRHLAAAGARIRTLGRKPPSSVPGGASGTAVIGDVLDREVWERALPGVDTIFHLAAQTSTKASERDPELDYKVNAEATWRMLEACRRIGNRTRIVFAGTETQCGIPPVLPLRGDEPDRPISFYDLHKLVAEQYLEFYARRAFVEGTSLRLTTLYGIGAGVREGSPDCGMLNLMIRNALSDRPLTIYGSGGRLRDYIHVDDVARAFLLAACSMDACNGRHFVVGSGERYTVKEAVELVARTAEQTTGRAVSVVHVDEPADEPEITKASFAVDPEPLRRATGWSPRYGLADGIAETVRVLHSTSRVG